MDTNVSKREEIVKTVDIKSTKKTAKEKKMQKTVLITGASSGIGKTCALFLAQRGYTVYAGSRTPEKLEGLEKNLHPIKLDLTDSIQIKKSMYKIYETEGTLDVVINNAGYGLISPIEEITDEQLYKQFDINLFSMFRICKEAISYLKKQKEGVIINISSYLGKVAFPLMSAYSASKFAVEGFSDALRYELEESSIRVHSLMPGFIKTNFTDPNTLVDNNNTSTHVSELFEHINKGSDPRIVAQAIFEIIENKNSKPRRYVGSDENKILSMREELADEDFDKKIIGDKSLNWNSLFYNASQNRYKIHPQHKSIIQTDVSNGIVSFDVDIKAHPTKNISIDNADNMLLIVMLKQGSITIEENETHNSFSLKDETIYLFSSSKQNISIMLHASQQSEIFVLAIADFVLKRYLSEDENELVNYLFNKTHTDIFTLLQFQAIDALSLYLLKGIKESYRQKQMQSILGEHRIIEFMLHQFSLLDKYDDALDETMLKIATEAKSILLKDFVNPPSIEYIAHQCATNKTKLQMVFKSVYKMTISEYVKKLRLQKANMLLKEQYLTIGEISKAVGYQHQGNFSKLFFKTYGVYPKELLKQNC